MVTIILCHPLLPEQGTKIITSASNIEELKSTLLEQFSLLNNRFDWWSGYNISFVDLDKKKYAKENPLDAKPFKFDGIKDDSSLDFHNISLDEITNLKIYFEQTKGSGGVMTEEDLKNWLQLEQSKFVAKFLPPTPIEEKKVYSVVLPKDETDEDLDDEEYSDEDNDNN